MRTTIFCAHICQMAWRVVHHPQSDLGGKYLYSIIDVTDVTYELEILYTNETLTGWTTLDDFSAFARVARAPSEIVHCLDQKLDMSS